MWFQVLVYRRAAANAIASGSQDSIIKAISHLMARSPSVLAPISSAT
jgi:hypothetical protein